jgi:hypothetical protein
MSLVMWQVTSHGVCLLPASRVRSALLLCQKEADKAWRGVVCAAHAVLAALAAAVLSTHSTQCYQGPWGWGWWRGVGQLVEGNDPQACLGPATPSVCGLHLLSLLQF